MGRSQLLPTALVLVLLACCAEAAGACLAAVLAPIAPDQRDHQILSYAKGLHIGSYRVGIGCMCACARGLCVLTAGCKNMQS